MKDTYYRIAENFADLMDNKFQILGIRFGLDPILNLIPGLGDILGVIFSIYLIFVAQQIGVKKNDIRRMWLNLFLDFVIGAIPLFGIIGDIFFRANQINFKIIKNYRNKQAEEIIEEGEIVG